MAITIRKTIPAPDAAMIIVSSLEFCVVANSEMTIEMIHSIQINNGLETCGAFLPINWYLKQGRIKDFKIEGTQKMCSAQNEREARNFYNSAGVHRARFKAMDALRF